MDVLFGYLPEILKKPLILAPMAAILVILLVRGLIRRAERKEALARRELMKRRLQV